MDFGVADVAAITTIVYIVCLGVKLTPLDHRWLPALSGFLGMSLGILAFGIGMPDFPAEDILTAAAVGGVSGLAATGVDQIRKQLKK